MNTKTDITHKYSYLMVNVKHKTQTITQITKRYFSYQLFVIGAVMTKACGGGGAYGDGGSSAILINGGAPIATAADRIVVSVTTGTVLTDETGDDTYLINYISGSGTIKLQVNPFDDEGDASGYDTVLIQGYSGGAFYPRFTGSDIITMLPGGSYTDIEFTFKTLDIFERFVFDVGVDVDGNVDDSVDGDGLINGSDFVWLLGNRNVNNVIEGTDVKDYIQAWDGNDIIYGNDGDDRIQTFGGNNIIHGGDGVDNIQTFINGNNVVYGDDGNDFIIIESLGNNKVYGGKGNDYIRGSAGNDEIYGGGGDDIIEGGDGDDTIVYNKGDGDDTIYGGDGDDVLILRGFVEDDIISQRMGNDLKLNFKESSGGGSIILIDSINVTDAGIDSILFDTNNNGIKDAEETIWEDEDFEGYLPRLIDGGLPIATAGIIDVIAQYNQNIGTRLILTNTPADATYLIDFDKVTTSSGRIAFGVDGGNIGASGFDTVLVQGYPENNFNDIAFEGGNNVRIEHVSKPNIIFEFANNDNFERFIFDIDGDGLINNNDFTWLIGGFDNSDSEIKGSNVKDYIRAWYGDDIIYGYAGDDIISGGGGDDIIEGGDGADTIDGYDGADIIDGGVGDDEIYGGLGDDTIYGGDGDDRIFYYKGDGNDVLSGGDGDDVLILVGFDEGDILNLVQTGADLKLNFKDTALGEDGGSIILKNSINLDAAGVDKIVFDTDSNGEDTTDIIWEDHQFADFIDGA